MNRLLFAFGATLLVGSALAQQPAVRDLLHFKTSIGSFKMIDGSGTATFAFEGTALLIDVQGDIKVEGALKKEFEDPKLKRKAYFGKGKITITGKWRGVQWFGSNMVGTIKGKSLIRLTGEFDKKLDTGTYWYGDRVSEARPWYTSGITVQVPEDPRLNPKPVRRGGFGGG